MNDPLEPLLQLRKRLERLDQARTPEDCFKKAAGVLEGLIPSRGIRGYLYQAAQRGYVAVAGLEGRDLAPTLLNWASGRSDVSSVPLEAGGSWILVPIPGQFKVLGVLAIDSSEDPGHLTRATILILELLARDMGRVLENLQVYEQMQRMRELLDNMIESVPHGILAVGRDDTVVACNRNSEILFGIKRIEVLNERYAAALPKPLAETVSGLIMTLLQDGFAKDAEFERPGADGQALPIGISCTLLRDKDGRPQGFLFICRDLSLSMEVQKLRELDRMKSEFVHTVSHELKTPLTAILGGTEVLQGERDALTPEQREMLDIIDQGGKRLHALIMDLLDLSRLESGRIGIERAETDLPPLIHEAVNNVRHKNPKCTLVMDIPEDFPTAMVDGDKLRQVFENYIGNALKYSPQGGEVTVRLALEGDRIRFAVKDQGIGIAPEHLPLLFEKFYRVDSSTTAEIEGTGLGLTIVKHIIELHEGELTVESALGKGSTFGFVIPFVRPATP